MFLINFINPNPKRRGKTKDIFVKIQGTNEVITFLIPKALSHDTLGQNILLVATTWVKLPISNFEGARIGLNLLTFVQGGMNPHLWAPTYPLLFIY